MAELKVTQLSVQYGRGKRTVNALSAVSLNVSGGEAVGVVGESGSGKSTLALALLGLTRRGATISAGEVELDGQNLLTMKERELAAIRGKRIGYVTQNPRSALDPVLRVGEQIAAVRRAHHPKESKAEAMEHALNAVRRVGINDPERRLEAFPHELSGGMAQRVVIAMGTVNAPDVLVADEPTSGLDVTVQRQILDDMREACHVQNTSLLLITQDLSVVANYCDRVYVMYSGEVVESSTTETLFQTPTHPCSAALLSIQRDAENASFRLAPLIHDGAPPADACWLASRCPLHRTESGCDSQHPELVVQANGSASRCVRASEVPRQMVYA